MFPHCITQHHYITVMKLKLTNQYIILNINHALGGLTITLLKFHIPQNKSIFIILQSLYYTVYELLLYIHDQINWER